MIRRTTILTVLLIAVLAVATVGPSMAQATTKRLSTNFTLINLGDGPAVGGVQYLKPDGTAWGAEDFHIPQPGGQAIFRQYYNPGQQGNPGLADGAGSAVVNADQPLGAVVQIQAYQQNPTSMGAYSGLSEGSSSFFVPLVQRKNQTASGIANSQIIVQNIESGTIDLSIRLIGSSGNLIYTKTVQNLAPGSSFYYDLALESASNVPDGWYGSAEVSTGGGNVVVVSNMFAGNVLQTYNAFPSWMPTSTWFVPLFASRLDNGTSTAVAVQNVSGGTIPAGSITAVCQPDPALGGSSITITNPAAVGNRASYFINPVTDMGIPAKFYGSCVVSAPENVVAFVQMRMMGSGEEAAYEALPLGETGHTAMVPLVAKRLANGLATAVTIQNMAQGAATLTLTYTPSPEYVNAGGSSIPIVLNNVSLGGNQSLIQNHRFAGYVPQLPVGWYGTLAIESTQPVGAFVQLTMMRDINSSLPSGDNFMAHTAFSESPK